MPGGSQIADHTFGIRALGYVLDKRGFDLAAQSRFDSLAPLFVLARPARLGDGRDIDKASLHGLGLRLRGGLGKSGEKKQAAASAAAEVLYMVFLYMARR